MYFFSNRLYSKKFSLNFGVPRYYLNFFRFASNENFGILHERAYLVGVYTPKQSRIRHCMFFLTDYIQSYFFGMLGRLDIILIFFDSRKIRLSVFYMREHMEFLYILQKRVE